MKRFFPALVLLLLASASFAAPVVYPGPVAVDDSGATVSPTSINVASVTDVDGNAIATPGAVAHVAGPNVSVVYDAAAKGEAWITLTPVLTGHTFINNPPRLFASADPQTLGTINTQTSSATRQSDMTTALTGQGYTPARAAKLDNADVATSTRSTFNGGAVASVTAPVTAGTVTDKTGYTVSTVQDKAGYSLGSTQAFSNSTASTVTPTWYTAPANLATVSLSTGDEAKIALLDAAISSRMATFTYSSPPTPPANWSLLNIDTNGKVALQSAEYASIASGVFAAAFTTIPGSHTSSGSPLTLTSKQKQALELSWLYGDNTSTVPAASGTATVTYYLVGQPKVTANIVDVATLTYDANKNQIGRTDTITAPFPAF